MRFKHRTCGEQWPSRRQTIHTFSGYRGQLREHCMLRAPQFHLPVCLHTAQLFFLDGNQQRNMRHHTFEIITSRHADYKLDLKINSRRECVGSIFPQNLRPCLYVWQFEIANCVTQMLMVAFCLDQPTLET